MKNIKVVVFIVLILFSVLYTYFFRAAISEASLGFFDGVVTTFVSTLLSIIVGILLYEYQQNENKKVESKRLESIVKAESKDIISIFSDGEGMSISLPSGRAVSVLITVISPLAHEEAGKSGQFNALITENLFHLSRKIRTYNMKVSHLLGLIQSSSNEAFLEHAINNINETKAAIIDGCKLVKDQIIKI